VFFFHLHAFAGAGVSVVHEVVGALARRVQRLPRIHQRVQHMAGLADKVGVAPREDAVDKVADAWADILHHLLGVDVER